MSYLLGIIITRPKPAFVRLDQGWSLGWYTFKEPPDIPQRSQNIPLAPPLRRAHLFAGQLGVTKSPSNFFQKFPKNIFTILSLVVVGKPGERKQEVLCGQLSPPAPPALPRNPQHTELGILGLGGKFERQKHISALTHVRPFRGPIISQETSNTCGGESWRKFYITTCSTQTAFDNWYMY